ncbi:cytoplasmic dynein 1 intermediate chain-like [Episyrphus balteatus]|uniref:cytoplasmic dynein 1 intermediate chain-like n=1 Tax=Episyrphus balteatus TaxID=286459 RepID=UPI00248555DB|nr:cytoplasmic dynein 1 intermediate chain-like [Episyrphus balteatus]
MVVSTQAYRHGIRSGVSEVYEKHLGPVTGISTHPNQSTPDFGDSLLTSSIDWTIKLWSLRTLNHYIHLKIIHPDLFASVDGSGRLDLWNFNQDTEVPSASVIVFVIV